VELHDGASGFVSAVVHGYGIAVRYGDHSDKVLAAYLTEPQTSHRAGLPAPKLLFTT
jgi:hypothetical protein